MKKITFAITGFVLTLSLAHASETLDADAVKKLITGNTVLGQTTSGTAPKIYFSPDGKAYRHGEQGDFEGTWNVNDDGMQCVKGLPGGCAKIIHNDDGTYDRVSAEGKILLKWTSVVNGKDF